MILSHQKFDYKNKCLIEKIIIQAPFRFSTNFHDEACFIYYFEGKAKINSSVEQQEIEPKESVLLKCGTYFADLLKYSHAGKYEILVFHLYPDLLRNIYSDEIPDFIKPFPNKSLIQKLSSTAIITKFVEGLYFYFENPSLVSEDLLRLKIKELILLLIQTKNAESIVTLFSDLFTPRHLNLREVVLNHLFSDLSTSDLAELCNLSLSTFSRTFQNIFNDTPANYIKNKRLDKAKELLSKSKLNISEIALKTCFADVAHFSKTFKAAFKMSPSEYRKATS
jgi:AraC family transcriptional regulator, exoenzyme S synthesis regulatory protein ExsA